MKRNKLKKLISIFLIFELLFLNFGVGITAYGATWSFIKADGSTQTMVENANNGVTIVNIASPTSGGVSVNNFDEFNVSRSGAVIKGEDIALKTQNSYDKKLNQEASMMA